MDKKTIIGVSVLLLVVVAIILISPSSNVESDISKAAVDNNSPAQDMQRQPMDQNTDSTDLPADRPVRGENDTMPPMEGEDQMRTPPEAITACENLVEGDTCSFSGREGDISGTCLIDQDILACGIQN